MSGSMVGREKKGTGMVSRIYLEIAGLLCDARYLENKSWINIFNREKAIEMRTEHWWPLGELDSHPNSNHTIADAVRTSGIRGLSDRVYSIKPSMIFAPM